MKLNIEDLIGFDTNNYTKIGTYNPHFVTNEDYNKSNTNTIISGLIKKLSATEKFSLVDLTSGSRLYSKNLVSKFPDKFNEIYLNDLNDFYNDYDEYENIYNYDILNQNFSNIIEQNIDNYIIFLNPYITTKTVDKYAIQASKLKDNENLKLELEKIMNFVIDNNKKFIFIFNSTKTDIYLDLFKKIFNCKSINPDILKNNNVSLYGKEDGYLFLTNITKGQYETEENRIKQSNKNLINKKSVNLLEIRTDFYNLIQQISENK